jgi:hypothetical protein
MVVSEPNNTLARPQSGAPALSPYDVLQLAECSGSAAIVKPSLFDYARIVTLFSGIWAICVSAAFWGLL